MAEDLADRLYHSLHDKLLALPDECELYPAHGAGSLCGRAMGAKRRSTIGYERKHNPALTIDDKPEFIKSLTSDMPPAPDHFSRCSRINADGPVRIRDLPPPREINAGDAAGMIDSCSVLDIRSYESFGGQHVPGAFHIDYTSNFATFAGWILPPDKPVLMVADTVEQAVEAAVWLRRVGVDDISGSIDGGMFEWALQGNDTGHVPQISASETHAMLNGPDSVTLLDVRGRAEYDKFSIENSVHIPVQDLRTEYTRLDDSAPILIMCGGGQRSSLGASILKRKGLKNLFNIAGGMSGFRAAGYVPVCPMCQAPHGPRFLGYTEPDPAGQ
jgi:rhodanese-related sulfurtransferase